MSPSADIQQFLQVVKSCKRIIIVAGAGLSAASGIPTFRGKGGLWRKYDAMSLATPEAFRENPSLVWQFYNYRRETALKAQPNAAHTAIARFSLPSVRESIAPGSKFTLITQNVDGLSSLALGHEMQNAEPRDKQDGPPRILEMHGRLFDVQCTECDHVKFDRSSPICEGLKGTEELVERNAMDPEIAIDSLPRCVKCGALARPGVVWFGEGDVVVEPGHFHYEANDVAGIQKVSHCLMKLKRSWKKLICVSWLVPRQRFIQLRDLLRKYARMAEKWLFLILNVLQETVTPTSSSKVHARIYYHKHLALHR